MKNKIHYSPESRRDLDGIWDYIVSDLQNRSAAERVTNRIMDAVDQPKNFAEIGTPLSSLQMWEQTIVFSSAAIIWCFTVCKVAMSTLTAFSMDEAII